MVDFYELYLGQVEIEVSFGLQAFIQLSCVRTCLGPLQGWLLLHPHVQELKDVLKSLSLIGLLLYREVASCALLGLLIFLRLGERAVEGTFLLILAKGSFGN